MKYLDRKYFIWLFVGVSAIIYVILLLIFPIESEQKTFIYYLKPLPMVVTGDLIFFFVFVEFMWKWKIFYDWLIPIPNIQGTWKGAIHSTWVDPKTNTTPNPIPVILTIKQTLLNTSCVMRTAEMESYSFTSGFVINKENQILRLFYSYDSIPKQTVKDRSPQHFGTMMFNISISAKGNKELTGEYWTGRKTTGVVNLKFWKKELINKYPEKLGKHPVSQIRNENTDNNS
ncbi:hypothetical protein WAF17_16755 [Bernardetia sp. ABR2-2B]|uniref:Cap15 family cyclic dinucleotide receptor domain-containing protein n=1 Tax=Bernardetia sp. ABR2-2B TaxID=3127472 RepID=UPI0030CD5276